MARKSRSKPRHPKLPPPASIEDSRIVQAFDPARYIDEPWRLDADDPDAAAAKARKRGGRGRPILIADAATLRIIQGLGLIWATKEEVAAVLGVTDTAIIKWFDREPLARRAFEVGLANGRISFRRDQRALAKTNGAVAIFLGKNNLGQRDVVELGGKLDIDDASESAKSRLKRKLGGRSAVVAAGGTKPLDRRLN